MSNSSSCRFPFTARRIRDDDADGLLSEADCATTWGITAMEAAPPTVSRTERRDTPSRVLSVSAPPAANGSWFVMLVGTPSDDPAQ